MTYKTKSVADNFFMAKCGLEGALLAAKRCVRTKTISLPYQEGATRIEKAENMAEVFDLCGYDIIMDDDGNITHITKWTTRQWGELLMFEAIAPFVRRKSYIGYMCELRGQFRYVWTGTTCRIITPTLTWEET